MIRSFHRLLILIFTFSTVITSWTTIVLLSSTTLDVEIKNVINKMYINQKDFLINVVDLSVLLVKDANDRFNNTNNEYFDLDQTINK